jgi:2-dehydropantoate 2-reductase
MRVGIIGAGAMGTFFAYALAQREEVTLLDARFELTDAIARHGVTVNNGPARKVRATQDPALLHTSGALFIFVKAHDTLQALRPFTGRLDPSTLIVSLQNGLGNEEAIKTALGAHISLVLGITNESCVSLAPGRSRRTGVGTTVVGSGGASQTAVHSIETMLEDAGLSASVVYDIRPHLWGKLIANAAINPTAALLDQKNAIVTSDGDAAKLAQALTLEGAAVARELKINLPFDDPWEYVCGVAEANADTYNTMTIDLSTGRRTEIEQINGAIVAAGKRIGVQTPCNETLLHLMRVKERVSVITA